MVTSVAFIVLGWRLLASDSNNTGWQRAGLAAGALLMFLALTLQGRADERLLAAGRTRTFLWPTFLAGFGLLNVVVLRPALRPPPEQVRTWRCFPI